MTYPDNKQINTYSDSIEVGSNYTQVPKYVIIQIGFIGMA